MDCVRLRVTNRMISERAAGRGIDRDRRNVLARLNCEYHQVMMFKVVCMKA